MAMTHQSRVIEVEAVRWDPEKPQPALDLLGPDAWRYQTPGATWLTVPTMAGNAIVYPGMWIIDVGHGLFRCVPHPIFEATYEEIPSD